MSIKTSKFGKHNYHSGGSNIGTSPVTNPWDGINMNPLPHLSKKLYDELSSPLTAVLSPTLTDVSDLSNKIKVQPAVGPDDQTNNIPFTYKSGDATITFKRVKKFPAICPTSRTPLVSFAVPSGLDYILDAEKAPTKIC